MHHCARKIMENKPRGAVNMRDILYIEEDDYDRHFLEYTFSTISHGRLQCTDYQSYRLFLNRQYNCILLGINNIYNLPHPILTNIRANTDNKETPIIGIIGFSDSSYQDMLNKLKLDAILTKPINLSVLKGVLNEMLTPVF